MQKFVLKVSEDNLNDFKSNLKSLRNSFENFEDTSEEKIEFKDFNENLNEDQFETE